MRLSKLQKWILGKALSEIPFYRDNVQEGFFGKYYTPSFKDKKLDWGDEDRAKKLGEKLGAEIIEDRERLEDCWHSEGGWSTENVKYRVIKDQYIATKAEEVTVSRTITNLVAKGLLTPDRKSKHFGYYLTEQGFLTANKRASGCTFINVNKDVAGGTTVNDLPAVAQTVNTSADKRTDVSFKSYEDYRAKMEEIQTERQKRRLAFEASMRGPSEEKKKKIADLEAKMAEYSEKFNLDNLTGVCCRECKTRIQKLQEECGKSEIERLNKELGAMT